MAAKKASTAAQTDDQYTKPELRDQIKAEVLAGDKGGKPGQWSARKAQLVAHEYEARGGGYKHERTEEQEHLHAWTAEHWQTSDGKQAERDGVTTRYLPAEAWEKLSPAERKATDAKKVKGSKEGQQFVANTRAASKARHKAEVSPEQARQTAESPVGSSGKRGSVTPSRKRASQRKDRSAAATKSEATKRKRNKT